MTDWDVCLRPAETTTGCVCLAQFGVVDSQGIEYLSFGGGLRGVADAEPWCLTTADTCSNASELNPLTIGQPTQLNVARTFPPVCGAQCWRFACTANLHADGLEEEQELM